MAFLSSRDKSAALITAIAGLIAAGALVCPAEGGSDSVELHVKAAYLLHFVRYVYWPNSPASPSTPVILGVLGVDPMVEVLESTVSGKTVNNRPIKVKLFNSPTDIDHCDVLFLPKSGSKQLQATLTATSGKPILTVSDSDKFSREGGMVEFLLVDDTVRFAINTGAAENAGLKLSSELLRVAYSVTGRRK